VENIKNIRPFVYLCLRLSFNWSFHIWGKTCDFCPSEEREKDWEYDCNSGLIYGDYKKVGKVKMNDREWILKYIASVYEGSIRKCIVSYWIIGEQGVRERVSNGGG
jgi:hypothetical protein